MMSTIVFGQDILHQDCEVEQLYVMSKISFRLRSYGIETRRLSISTMILMIAFGSRSYDIKNMMLSSSMMNSMTGLVKELYVKIVRSSSSMLKLMTAIDQGALHQDYEVEQLHMMLMSVHLG